MTKKGQASIEALLILSAVLVTVAYLQMSGQDSFETTNAISSARQGVQIAITELTIQNGAEISISNWGLDGDNIVFYLAVQGGPPPDNESIISNVENIAQNHLEKISGEYIIEVKIEKRVGE